MKDRKWLDILRVVGLAAARPAAIAAAGGVATLLGVAPEQVAAIQAVVAQLFGLS